MRQLAADLGVTPMSIYHYVANKPALLDALIERIWRQIIDDFTADETDLIEWIMAMSVRTREVWLENAGLANLASAVAEPDNSFYANTLLSAQIMEAAGFPDPVLAYSTIQTFIMGSIAVAANRRFASRFFGRDPAEVLRRAEAMLEGRDAGPEHRGIVHARFEEGDTKNFERGLRALMCGLLRSPARR